MSEPIPQFGPKLAGVTYIDRPGVYGVMRDQLGRVAVVKVDQAYFLPGGGITAGEQYDEAFAREAMEECGRCARILRPIGRADQHCTTRAGRHFNKQCSYFEAEFFGESKVPPLEPDHELQWLNPADALDRLELQADAWALRKVIEGR